MLSVFLLRHGETEWNADGNRYCGRSDIDLTQRGVSQAESVGRQLKGAEFDAVYCSPLLRAKRTAEIASGRVDIVADERLIEIDFGNWEGKTREQFIDEDPSLWNRWCTNPACIRAGGTGETGADAVARVNDFYNTALEKHPSGNILVVGHNGINRFYLTSKLGMELRNYRRIAQENSALTMFSLDGRGELTLRLLNAHGTFVNFIK